jgi:hypothetical protein
MAKYVKEYGQETATAVLLILVADTGQQLNRNDSDETKTRSVL